MSSYTFKKGPVMPEQTWTVDGGSLSGPNESINLRDVTSGHFLYTPGKIGIAQFGVASAGGSINLQCNARASSDSHRAFAELIMAVLGELKQLNPGVTFSPPPNENRIRRVGQFIGVLGVVYGIYFFVANGLLADEAAGLGFGLGGGIIALSVFWIWATAPISTKPTTLDETMAWVGRAYGMQR